MTDVAQLRPLDPASLLAATRRERDIAHLAAGATVDVVVVGGGITGVGVALDAVTRGLSVALLEADDLANGTSRWSSKLVHGGLRYLAKGDPAVAWESAVERAIIAGRMAPHLVHPLAQVVPDFADNRRSARLALLGQRAGDGLRIAAGTPTGLLPRARHVDPDVTRQLVPGIRTTDLRGASVGWDCQLIDDARLVVAVARTAAAYGARVLTRVRVDAIDENTGEVAAVDATTGQSFVVRGTTVVNATGVWAADLDDSITLHPSLGTHVVMPTALVGAGHGSLTVPVPDTIGRFILSLPQPGGISYVGLTDHEVATDDFAAPTPPADDIAWILEILSLALDRPVTPADALGSFAGVRPLVQTDDHPDAPSADISRRHLVRRSGHMITVTGGKLTTFRRMAADTVNLITDTPCRTPDVALIGAGPREDRPDVPAVLWRRYGNEAPVVWDLGEVRPELRQPIVPGGSYYGVEAEFGVAAEGALTVSDIVDRRTRLGLVDDFRDPASAWASATLGDRLVAPALA
ncbi:MAG: glycerol-3-phosphate dehydrogenase/oxidase [Candidatus Nanopelagicales bacterium]